MKGHEEGVHWSKDFVEHLRTVHFALIAVCVGLIALSLAHPAGPLEMALKQLQGIKQVTGTGQRRFHAVGENYSDWVDEWAGTQVKRAIDTKQIRLRTPEDQVMRAHGEILSPEVSCVTPDGSREYDLNQQWVLIQPSGGERLDPAFLRTQVRGEGAVVETAALGLPKDMRLDDFKRLWNFLHHRMTIVVPISRGSKVFLWDGKQSQWSNYPCTDTKSPTGISAFLNIGLVSDPERWAKLAPRVGDEPPRYGYVSNDNTVFVSLDQFNSVNFDGQGWFVANIPTTPGTFADSFTELDELSAGFSNQSLDTVERVLKNKQNDAAEVFEAFGIKIPVQVVMRFGILLVIAVQLYFLTHLIELSKRLDPNDPGWEVAWVGVYNHRLARVVYFCTIVVLPVLSIVGLGKRSLSQLSRAEGWMILLTGIALDLLVAFFIWKETPYRSIKR